MRRIMSMLCCGLILAGTTFAVDEQILLRCSAKGAQMSPLFTAKDHWEVRWKTDKGRDGGAASINIIVKYNRAVPDGAEQPIIN